jgi:hypothetical protein
VSQLRIKYLDTLMRWLGWPPKDRPMFWITVTAFLAVCVYAYFTEQQVNETRNANDIATAASYTANRPYLMWAITRAIPIVPPNSTEATGWLIMTEFQNLGKTPATNARVQFCEPIVRPNSVKPVFTCTISETPAQNEEVLGLINNDLSQARQ